MRRWILVAAAAAFGASCVLNAAPTSVPASRSATDIRATGLDAALFPLPASLRDSVYFWEDVFGKYSLNQSIVHSASAPSRIIQVLDFPADISNAERNAQERQAIAAGEKALSAIVAANAQPARMDDAARHVYDVFGGGSVAKFKALEGTLRTQRGQRERTRQGIETAGRYLPTMRRIFANYGLPTALTRLPIVESSFNVQAYSKAGAAGIWQFMPASARIYMTLNAVQDDRRDPWTSTDAAARMLKDNYAALGNWPLAITAYNYGRGGIQRALAATGGSTLSDLIAQYDNPRFGFASSNFYAEFLAANAVANHAEAYFGTLTHEAPIRFNVVTTTNYVPYTTLQRISGASRDEFAMLNPAFSAATVRDQLYTPPGTAIRVPVGQKARFDQLYAALGPGQRFTRQRVWYVAYRVRRGDTLSGIARHHHVSTQDLMRMNSLHNARHLRAGQRLRIPTRGAPHLVAAADRTPRSNVIVHRVTHGQTLSSIAANHHVTVNRLRIANHLRDADYLRVGMLLKIPVAR